MPSWTGQNPESAVRSRSPRPRSKPGSRKKLVAAFSDIQVFDAAGKEVDKHDKRLDTSNQALLIVSLPPLKAGKYKVVWKAVSVDTHVTRGDFTFDISP